MAKKRKKDTAKKRTPKTRPAAAQTQKRSKFPWLVVLAGGVLALTGAYFLYEGQTQPTPSSQFTKVNNENINLREKRTTLSPQMFTGKVRKAYAIARTIPEVLDGLYCYCRCRENFGHKNLLSCYVDTHAST
jgi:hypothetical protein